MVQTTTDTLEGALARTEAATETTLTAAGAMTRALKRARAAAKAGNLRDLRAALEAAEQAAVTLQQEANRTRRAGTLTRSRTSAAAPICASCWRRPNGWALRSMSATNASMPIPA